MKQKIEFNQEDLINMLVEKVNFLTSEYISLLSAFQYDIKKGRANTDPIKITESHERFLKQYGDVNRILEMHKMFSVEQERRNNLKNKNDE